MSNRYWIGGSGEWRDTAHWSTTNGGGGGASIPTASDNVYITSSSGFGAGGTISANVEGDYVCADFICNSGHTYESLFPLIYGSVSLDANVTTYWGGNTIQLFGAGSHTITTNGVTVIGTIYMYGAGTYTLADNLTLDEFGNGSIQLYSGTLDANDKNVTTYSFSAACNGVLGDITVNMGSGTWEIKGFSGWTLSNWGTDEVLLNAETSTLKFTYLDSNTLYLGSSKTYNNVEITINGSGGCALNPDGSVINNLTITNTEANSIYIDAGSTLAASTLNINGSAGKQLLLAGNGGTFTLSQASGTVNASYLDIQNCTAQGGATFNAGITCRNRGNVTGWNWFISPLPSHFRM